MTNEYPLVSAILLAGKSEPRHIVKAKNCFDEQSYPNKELIIVNNSANITSNQYLYDMIGPNIYVVDTPMPVGAGSARNFGVAAANGDILAQFDANYWHHPNRLSIQILALATNSCHISMISESMEASLISGRYTYQRNASELILNSMVWVKPKNTYYPDVNNHEERPYIEALMKADYKVVKFKRPELMCKLHISKYHNIQEVTHSDIGDDTSYMVQCLAGYI